MGWAGLAGGPAPFSTSVDQFKYVVFKNPNWDYRTLDFDKDVVHCKRALQEAVVGFVPDDLSSVSGWHTGKLSTI